MSWKETCTVEQRMKLVVDYDFGEESVAELSRQYGISRKTVYKWIRRFDEEGPAGLADRSRAPQSHPRQVGVEIEAAVVAIRAAHPTWGPKKIRVVLERQALQVPQGTLLARWPARSTIAAIVKRHGLSFPRKHRRRVPPQEAPFAACDGPNALWCADFKGWFRTGDGVRCDPLTISDAYSRYLLRCQVVRKTGGRSVRPLFEAAFREYGLPAAIRTDNGPPFASRGIGGFSPLSIWWIKLGIAPERIEPGKPQQNGRHERMHLTLKQDTAMPPAANLRRQQERFDAFRREFNEDRPHEALGMQTPSSSYEPSPRPYGERVKDMEYPAEMTLRRVCDRGEFRWKVTKVFLGRAFEGELIGLAPMDGRHWRICFGRMVLGVLDDHRRRLLTPRERRQVGLDETFCRSSFRCAPGTPADG